MLEMPKKVYDVVDIGLSKIYCEFDCLIFTTSVPTSAAKSTMDIGGRGMMSSRPIVRCRSFLSDLLYDSNYYRTTFQCPY